MCGVEGCVEVCGIFEVFDDFELVFVVFLLNVSVVVVLDGGDVM